ncbi:MAG: aldehyde dehydrogenase family protein [Deltaproteobacteria bacterium]|nr:MAG: aldehyde dehydrogenase family protein [Deltaproteobacteria bacterium]
MKADYPLMVVGMEERADATIEVVAPFDRSPIATVAAGGPEVVEQALDTADRLFRNRDLWMTPAQRIEILGQAAKIMESRAEGLALEAAREGGKPLIDSQVEVARAIDGVRNCIEVLRTESGREIPMNVNAASLNRLALTHREPRGVVVAVSAFNHPLNLIVHQVGPAVATGCPVIVKPAADTPLSCFRFVEILREAGLPEGWCQALLTDTHETAEKLVTDPRVAFFSFIGSAEVGWRLRSRLAPGTRCALEHGGVAPVVMAEDADLDDAIPRLAKGGFYHAGQVCVSVQRVFAHRTIAEEVGDRLARAAEALRVGDPTLPDTEVGPLIRPAEVDRVESWVHEAVSGGGRLLCGGKRLSDTCHACTVLYDPPADAKVSRAEVFGPVVCVYPYDDLDEAIERANALPFAFQAAVFTRSLDTALRAYERFDAATVIVNDHTAFRVDWMPFAGLRHSGLGIGGIPYTMHDMQVDKLLVIRSAEL